MISDGKMDVQLDVSKASRVSRLEVIEGPTGRRTRSAAEKAKIAAESLVPGAQVATVARKHVAVLFHPSLTREGASFMPQTVFCA